MLKATVNGLQRLRRPDEVAATRGLTISQVLPVSSAAAAPEETSPVEPEDTSAEAGPVEPDDTTSASRSEAR
jgi:hypothetical protein